MGCSWSRVRSFRCVCSWAFTVFHMHSLQMGGKRNLRVQPQLPPECLFTRFQLLRSKNTKATTISSTVITEYKKVMLGVPAQYRRAAPMALQAHPPGSSRDTAVPREHQVNNGKTQAKSDNRNSWVLRKGGDCADDVAVGHGPCCRAAAAPSGERKGHSCLAFRMQTVPVNVKEKQLVP